MPGAAGVLLVLLLSGGLGGGQAQRPQLQQRPRQPQAHQQRGTVEERALDSILCRGRGPSPVPSSDDSPGQGPFSGLAPGECALGREGLSLMQTHFQRLEYPVRGLGGLPTSPQRTRSVSHCSFVLRELAVAYTYSQLGSEVFQRGKLLTN